MADTPARSAHAIEIINTTTIRLLFGQTHYRCRCCSTRFAPPPTSPGGITKHTALTTRFKARFSGAVNILFQITSYCRFVAFCTNSTVKQCLKNRNAGVIYIYANNRVLERIFQFKTPRYEILFFRSLEIAFYNSYVFFFLIMSRYVELSAIK